MLIISQNRTDLPDPVGASREKRRQRGNSAATCLSVASLAAAGMAAFCTGILAPSGRLFFGYFLFGEAKESIPPPRGKRQLKNIRAADTKPKQRRTKNQPRLAANLGH